MNSKTFGDGPQFHAFDLQYLIQLIGALIVYQRVDQSIVVLIDMLASVSRAARRAYPEVQACFRTVSSTQAAMNTSLRPDVRIIPVIC